MAKTRPESGPPEVSLQDIGTAMRRLENAIRTVYVPNTFRATCGYLLCSAETSYVSAPGGAIVDGGLYLRDNSVSLSTDPNKRMLEVLGSDSDTGRLLPIDCETISPRINKKERGMMIYYGIEQRSGQKDCALLLVQNPDTPEWVAVIPRLWLESPPNLVTHDRGYVWPSAPYTGFTTEPFPPLIWPVVMPMRRLPEALSSYEAFARDPSLKWRNPYTGHIILEAYEAPDLRSVSMLKPTAKGHIQDHHIEREITQHLQAESRGRYKVQRLIGKFNFGDLAIVYRDGTRFILHIKQAAFKLERGKIIHYAYTRTTDEATLPIFCALTQFDYLFTTDASSGMAMLAPLDQLPEAWFKVKKPARNSVHRWNDASSEFLALHVFRWRGVHGRQRAASMMRVLEHYRTTSGLLRNIDRPFSVHKLLEALPAGIAEDSLYAGGATTTRQGIKRKRGNEVSEPIKPSPRMGQSRIWSPQLWEQFQELRLQHLCNVEECGAIYRLGVHPSARYAFGLGTFRNNDRPVIHELSVNCDMIYINFAPVDILESTLAYDLARPSRHYHITHGEKPCLFILTPVRPNEERDEDLIRYVIPSAAFSRDEVRMRVNNRLLEQGSTAKALFATSRPLHLEDDLIDAFAVREKDLVKLLIKIYLDIADLHDPSYDHLPDIRAGTDLDLSTLLVQRADLLHELTLVRRGQTFWKANQDDAQEGSLAMDEF